MARHEFSPQPSSPSWRHGELRPVFAADKPRRDRRRLKEFSSSSSASADRASATAPPACADAAVETAKPRHRWWPAMTSTTRRRRGAAALALAAGRTCTPSAHHGGRRATTSRARSTRRDERTASRGLHGIAWALSRPDRRRRGLLHGRLAACAESTTSPSASPSRFSFSSYDSVYSRGHQFGRPDHRPSSARQVVFWTGWGLPRTASRAPTPPAISYRGEVDRSRWAAVARNRRPFPFALLLH